MGDMLDTCQLANYTLPEGLREGDKVRQLEIGPKLRTQVREYLQKQGYEVTEGAKLLGKSGIEHTFDMLARRGDSFTSYIIAVCITAGGDRELEVGTISSYANKSYYTGILDRVLIAVPELGQEAKKLAQKQRIKIIDGEQMGSLLDLKELKPPQPVKPKAPFRLTTCSHCAPCSIQS